MLNTAERLYDQFRIRSVTRPENTDGLPSRFLVMDNRDRHSLDDLRVLTAEALRFYIDGDELLTRGEERFTEKFVLEACAPDGDWVFVMNIEPLPGTGYNPEFGSCKLCRAPLDADGMDGLCDSCFVAEHGM